MKTSLRVGWVFLLAVGLAACGDDSSGGGGSGGGSDGGSNEGGAGGEGTGGDPGTGGTTTDGGGGQGTGGEGTGGGSADEPTVTLTLESDTVSPGNSLEGTVTVTNFVLEAPTGQPNEDGHGHYHIYLDGATGGNYLTNGQTESVSIPIPLNTSTGPHTLRISVSGNDHDPLVPAVEQIVDITVE